MTVLLIRDRWKCSAKTRIADSGAIPRERDRIVTSLTPRGEKRLVFITPEIAPGGDIQGGGGPITLTA